MLNTLNYRDQRGMMADVTYRNGPTSSRVFILETMNSNTTDKFGLAYTASLPGFYILFLLDMFLCYAVAGTISKRHSSEKHILEMYTPLNPTFIYM